MKLMKTTEAVGQVLCHDITQIIPGVKKDAVFRKGHIITKEDIPVLLSVGKDTIYIWENDETMMHENEAAEVLYRMSACGTKKIEADTQSGVSCGTVSKMHPSPVKEGKIEVIADCDGLLKVDSKKLEKVNSFGELMIATRHGNTTVKKGDKLAGTRIIPLVIKKDKLKEASNICEDGPILDIKPFVVRKAAIITTGNEVYHGRIQDAFTPVIEKKIAEFGAQMMFHEVFDDDDKKITDGCLRLPSKIQAHGLCHTARRCCREPCFCCRTMMQVTGWCRYVGCPAVPCTISARYLILCCLGLWHVI